MVTSEGSAATMASERPLLAVGDEVEPEHEVHGDGEEEVRVHPEPLEGHEGEMQDLGEALGGLLLVEQLPFGGEVGNDVAGGLGHGCQLRMPVVMSNGWRMANGESAANVDANGEWRMAHAESRIEASLPIPNSEFRTPNSEFHSQSPMRLYMLNKGMYTDRTTRAMTTAMTMSSMGSRRATNLSTDVASSSS